MIFREIYALEKISNRAWRKMIQFGQNVLSSVLLFDEIEKKVPKHKTK